MANPFENKHILLGVTGSIACYKAADLASKLAQSGAQVDVLLSQAALEFVTPLTFQSVTGRRAYTDADLWGNEAHVIHVGLGHSTDLVVIAPATANTIAKLAHGIADSLLTVTSLAAQCPILVAPAMDGGMYAHPATQENIETLKKRGVRMIGPASGHLASGMTGVGRMVEPQELLAHIRRELVANAPESISLLKGKKVVITAGGTQEPIDPVRVIANRSSGKQGYALAQVALDLGAEVVLVSGPVQIAPPFGARVVNIHTAQEMLEVVVAECSDADALIMAAAVADFRPIKAAEQKIKKEGGIPEIQLEKTADILGQVSEDRTRTGFPRVIVGFAAESQRLIENARHKLLGKKLDLIVANDIRSDNAGFGVDTNQVTILFQDGRVDNLPLMSKVEVAGHVLEHVAGILRKPANS